MIPPGCNSRGRPLQGLHRPIAKRPGRGELLGLADSEGGVGWRDADGSKRRSGGITGACQGDESINKVQGCCV